MEEPLRTILQRIKAPKAIAELDRIERERDRYLREREELIDLAVNKDLELDIEGAELLLRIEAADAQAAKGAE